METISTLFDVSPGDDVLTPVLHEAYGGPLTLLEPSGDSPVVMVNFVTTIDGRTSFRLPGHMGGGDISGFNQQDTFIMGLLRAVADAVIVGANTLRSEGEHLWTADFITPNYAEPLAELRQLLGKSTPHPLNMFVTAKGNVLPEPAKHVRDLPAAFRTKGVEPWVITTETGQERLSREFGAVGMPNILTFNREGEVNLPEMLSHLRQRMGVKLLLVEGGASMNGAFVRQNLYHELFQTIAPQLIGNTADSPRPSLIEGFAFTPEEARWHDLVSVKRHASHLFLRYRRRS